MHTRECDAASRDTGGQGARPLSRGPPSCYMEAQTCSRRTLTTMRDLSARVQESWHHRGHLMGACRADLPPQASPSPAGCRQGPHKHQLPPGSRGPLRHPLPCLLIASRALRERPPYRRSPEGQDRVLVLPCLSQCLHSRQTCERGGAHSEKRLQLPSARDLFSNSDLQFVSEGSSLQWESITFLFVELPDLHLNSRSMQARDSARLPDPSKYLEKVLSDPSASSNTKSAVGSVSKRMGSDTWERTPAELRAETVSPRVEPSLGSVAALVKAGS